jgi:RNA methyltransferase, TrmH family
MEMRGREHITSRENSKLKHVRRVRDGKESGWIFIEGVRLAEEALRSALAIRSAFVSTDALEKERIEALAGKLERRGVEVLEVAERLFPSITDTPHPQGIVLTADKPAAGREVLGAAVDARTPPLVLYLNRISDPGNLGAIARTAEAAGVSGAILSMNSAGAFSPRALRASMGSGFRLPFWEGVEPHEAFVWARGRRLKVTAAAAGGSV